jgi:hypothetical protein
MRPTRGTSRTRWTVRPRRWWHECAEGDGAGGANPDLHLDRLIEQGDTVAVVGHGSVDLGSGTPVDFVYSEVFTFTDGLVNRLDTFHVWLDEVPAA